uniref:Uncharacterized protein n=1 Tax=Micrurus spixii TaxID=129469 RepID=A0A2D4MLV1_9SAUR
MLGTISCHVKGSIYSVALHLERSLNLQTDLRSHFPFFKNEALYQIASASVLTQVIETSKINIKDTQEVMLSTINGIPRLQKVWVVYHRFSRRDCIFVQNNIRSSN